MSVLTQQVIAGFTERLEQHEIYAAVKSIADLRCFMEHHVYSVWDFMSLIKYLQHTVAPTHYPWVPPKDGDVSRFINELVLEEESDETAPGLAGEYKFSSHFEMYCGAMQEIGADTAKPIAFVKQVGDVGVAAGLKAVDAPAASVKFCEQTFAFIGSGKPHVVAAALALGREHIIPYMFRSFLKNLGVTEQDAPTFYYYLNRHVHLDGDFHAPLSLRLLNSLCGDDTGKQEEAIDAAETAVNARIEFWDGVLKTINK